MREKRDRAENESIPEGEKGTLTKKQKEVSLTFDERDILRIYIYIYMNELLLGLKRDCGACAVKEKQRGPLGWRETIIAEVREQSDWDMR